MTNAYKADLPDLAEVEDVLKLPNLRIEYRDAQHDNNARAIHAGHALLAFTDRVGVDELSVSMADLVCNLMHLADAADVDWDTVVDNARGNYAAEISGAGI